MDAMAYMTCADIRGAAARAASRATQPGSYFKNPS
jgi:hypothetical protein